MFTKYNDINIRYDSALKRHLVRKENLRTLSSPVLAQWHESPSPNLANLQIFIICLPLNVTLFSLRPYLTAHIKTSYETDCIGWFSLKNTKMYPEPSPQPRSSSLWHK